MKKVVLLLTIFFLDFSLGAGHVSTATAKHYVVYMGQHSYPNSAAVVSANHAILSSVTGNVTRAEEASVQHYSKSFRGFSAMLTPEQAHQLGKADGVISVFESRTHRVHTTHSWDFLGLSSHNEFPQQKGDSEDQDVIIGSIDTGIWPESESFDDECMGPVPERFKGECVTGDNFNSSNCNRKIIGARFYSKGFEAENGPLESVGSIFFRSARDSDGHGTHTASTAAGSVVSNASLIGIGRGSARGGATGARLAIYKACWFNLCSDADFLSAFDDATSDGVDIISISAGPSPPQPSFFGDAISIGSFHAFSKGILTSASAGNAGLPNTATNVAPWLLTVAASSVDRRFESNVILGNSKVLKGQSLNPLALDGFFSIIPASLAAAPGVSPQNASFCKNNTLNAALIHGKIVLCTIETVNDDRTAKSIVVKEAGGVGMILVDPIAIDVGFQFVIPATLIGLPEATELKAYLATQNNSVASISRTETVLKTKPAPEMAVFSSMGPNIITPDIIKPDITAPGLNILAAWSPVAVEASGLRSVSYNIISGTSMSCPHVSAAAAIIKSRHPYWSPAAIKSALMTTSSVLDNTKSAILRDPNGSPTTPFDFGSGHLDPVAALNPGLVYDFDSDDIIDFLCATGASPAQLQNLPGEGISCKKMQVPSYNLNYPSIAVSNMSGSVSVRRTVTYYGKGQSTFTASVDNPVGVNVTVTPTLLEFEEMGQRKSYRLDFVPVRNSNGSFVFGAITWRDESHFVTSPIALNVVSV